jgi:quinoprotein glucose dehydrogenase
MYTSPLVVDGVLYGLSPKLVAFALDGATGAERWRSDPGIEGAQRGLMWWEKGDDRRLFYTAGKTLIALNAEDGTPVAGFGDGGRVDLTPDPSRGYLAVTVPGVVFEDMIVLGFSTTESAGAQAGSIRAFSALDGAPIWQFDTIPADGQPGAETWAEGALETAGGANGWSGMALDEKRGLLFAPTGSATPDFYGAKRLGDNLYANCLLAIDVRSGELRWHYQVVRHDLWDKDNPSPPTLVQLKRDGTVVEAVALTTKTGHLYLFERDSGESLYPILEVPTPIPSELPGERPAASQRLSSVAFSRQQFEVTRRTPEATAFVEAQIKGWDLRPWAPPKVGTVLLYPWYDGGAEWGGSAFEPGHNRLILNANDAAGVLKLTEVPIGFSNYSVYTTHCASCHGLELEGSETAPVLAGVLERMTYEEILSILREGRGRMPAFAHLDDAQRGGVLRYLLAPEPAPDEPSTEVGYVLGGYPYLKDQEGLPGNTPPWGTLSSIDLASGDFVWQVPFGDFPSHPDLGYGALNYGGPVVTATGVIFIAATPDRKFRAYHSETGEVLWATELGAAGFSTPAIYAVGGKQYVVIAAGGGRLGPPSAADYYAFTLP